MHPARSVLCSSNAVNSLQVKMGREGDLLAERGHLRQAQTGPRPHSKGRKAVSRVGNHMGHLLLPTPISFLPSKREVDEEMGKSKLVQQWQFRVPNNT